MTGCYMIRAHPERYFRTDIIARAFTCWNVSVTVIQQYWHEYPTVIIIITIIIIIIIIIIITMIIIIIIILYSNKWIRGGFTKSHIINYMD